MSTLFTYIAAVFLALIPAILWFVFLRRKKNHQALQLGLFIGSTLTVIPILVLDLLGKVFPIFDFPSVISSIFNQSKTFVLVSIFIVAGMMEEIVKQSLVRWLDTKKLVIQTIGDSIHFSLMAALGFSFAENILYVFHLLSGTEWQNLIVVYLFRSAVTTAGHLLFSGIFGYFYGVAKFSITINKPETWTTDDKPLITFISRFLGISRLQTHRELTIIKGLLLAIVCHAFFNYLLQGNHTLAALFFVIIGFVGLQYLLKRKSSQLVLVTDIATQHVSTMAKKDEDVVLELLDLWFKEKRYVDVLHVCQRLKERDPGNPVVELFRTKALDKMDQQSAYHKILTHLFLVKEAAKHR